MRCALLCLVVACGGPQIQERKAADLSKLGPATLEAKQPKEGEPRTAKIRIWVDAGVRAVPQWKEDITDQIDYAGQLLTPLLGVQLKIDAFKDWDRTGDPSDALNALAQADKSDDMIWVIGYVTPGDAASKAMSELGNAQLLGRYVVVRGWAEKPETDALSSGLPDLKPAEKNEVLAAHKRHKQTVVLLHMIGRTLGAIYESDEKWIQNPTYSPKQETFADRTRELMQMAIDGRLGAGTDQTIAHELLEKIEKENWGGWIAANREEVVTQLRGIVTAGKAGQVASDIPMAAMEPFERIKSLAGRGDFTNAKAELDNLLIAYPGNATMYLLKCELMKACGEEVAPAPAPKGAAPASRCKPAADKAVAACFARAVELAPDDPAVHFALAEGLARKGDAAGAHAELKQAAGKIAKLKTGAADQWKRVIAMYQAMGSLTWTEDAAAAAKLDGDTTAAQIASTRARYGIPRGTKLVKPEAEAALVTAVRESLNLVYANKYAEAEKAIAAGEKKWPGAPGFAAARCDLALRKALLPQAKAACNKALEIDANLSWALYLSGVIALKDTSAAGTKTGIEKLKKAITVDPELGQAWRTLAKAYARAKDKPALDQLAKDYAAKFGTPLPQ